jgi:CBS domain containing-hemolysin-like protein
MVLKIIATLGLVALNAFFVTAEYAAVSARASRLRLSDANNMSARAARLIKTRLDLFLSSCQLGTSLSALALGAVTAPAVASLLVPLMSLLHWSDSNRHLAAFIISFALAVALQLVIGEQTPKNIAIEHPDRMLALVAIPSRDLALERGHAGGSAPHRRRKIPGPAGLGISPAHGRGVAYSPAPGGGARHHSPRQGESARQRV